MELFTLTLTKEWAKLADKLYVRLSLAARDLHNVWESIKLDCDAYRTHTDVRCTAGPGFRSEEHGPVLVRKTAETLARFILDEVEERLIREMITGPYRYVDPEEVAAIEQYCRQALNGTESGEPPKTRLRRQNKIADAVCGYLENRAAALNVIGFIRFRLPEYVSELKEVVEYAIDEYMMDRQYQEFISLLKYFVYIQDAKIPVAHLMHHGGNEFSLFNEQMMPIDTKPSEGFTVELIDKEINFEDMIVSTLITVSPKNICIHTRDPEEQVIKTIMQIFEGRAKICKYCKLCHPALGGQNKDQLYP